jgi:hypothetical protein
MCEVRCVVFARAGSSFTRPNDPLAPPKAPFACGGSGRFALPMPRGFPNVPPLRPTCFTRRELELAVEKALAEKRQRAHARAPTREPPRKLLPVFVEECARHSAKELSQDRHRNLPSGWALAVAATPLAQYSLRSFQIVNRRAVQRHYRERQRALLVEVRQETLQPDHVPEVDHRAATGSARELGYVRPAGAERLEILAKGCGIVPRKVRVDVNLVRGP